MNCYLNLWINHSLSQRRQRDSRARYTPYFGLTSLLRYSKGRSPPLISLKPIWWSLRPFTLNCFSSIPDINFMACGCTNFVVDDILLRKRPMNSQIITLSFQTWTIARLYQSFYSPSREQSGPCTSVLIFMRLTLLYSLRVYFLSIPYFHLFYY